MFRAFGVEETWGRSVGVGELSGLVAVWALLIPIFEGFFLGSEVGDLDVAGGFAVGAAGDPAGSGPSSVVEGRVEDNPAVEEALAESHLRIILLLVLKSYYVEVVCATRNDIRNICEWRKRRNF